MKKNRHDVESELKSLVPKSPSRGLADRIAGQLANTEPVASSRSMLVWAAPVLAMAAGITLAVAWWPSETQIPGAVPSVKGPKQPAKLETPLPTVLAYQRVFCESPDDFDQLLDEHATSLLVASSNDDVGSLRREMMNN